MSRLLSILSLACLCGCGTVVANRTTIAPDGTRTLDSIKATAFLENIKQGTYTSSSGMSLTITEASSDTATISALAGVVGDLGKSAMLMASRTNSPATNNPALK